MDGEVDDERTRKMRRIVEEMMETEAIYVQALADIEDKYLLQCLHNRKPKGPLEALDVEIVFANIQALRNLHEEFLGVLNSAYGAPAFAGAIFLDQVEAFKQHYVEYCANSNAAIDVLSAWLSDPAIAEFLNSLNKEYSKPLGLGPELLKPVQRILKYPLLLKELLKVSNPDDDAYIQALEAVKKLNEVAEEINDRKRAAENMEKVLNLERRLENHKKSLLDYGLMILHGCFKVLESRKNRTQDRWLYLFEKGLMIAREDNQQHLLRTRDESNLKLYFKNFIEVSGLAVSVGKGTGPDKCYFEVNGTVDGKLVTYTVYCANEQQKQQWVDKMNELRNNSLVAFLKAKAVNEKVEDQDGTVGLNREKMRLREERLVQLRSRKKGERIPPVPKNVQTLYKQGQRMPVQRAQSTASPAPIDRLKEKSVQRSASAADLQRSRQSIAESEQDVRSVTASPSAELEDPGEKPAFARSRRPPPPTSPRQSRVPASPPPSSPPNRPRRLSAMPEPHHATAAPPELPPPRARSSTNQGPPPSLPPRIPPRAASVANINPDGVSATNSMEDLHDRPLSRPQSLESERDTAATSEAPKLRVIRPPGAPVRGPPPFMPRGGPPSIASRPPAPRPPAPASPRGQPPPLPEVKSHSPPPIAPKPPAPPGLASGQHRSSHTE